MIPELVLSRCALLLFFSKACCSCEGDSKVDSKDIKEIKFILCSWKDEGGMHECQGWLFGVLANATVGDDVNPIGE